MKNRLALFEGERTINHQFKRFNTIGIEEINSVVKVMESGKLSSFLGSWGPEFYGGKYVKALEKAFEKKGIVFLEESRLVYVVIFMEKPHQTMHDILVRNPRHSLHSNEGGQYNSGCLKKRYQGFHFNPFRSMKNTANMATRVAAPMFFEVRYGKQ